MTKVVELVPRHYETPPEVAQEAREKLERAIHEGFLCIMFVVERFPNPMPLCEIAGSVPDSMAVRGGLARYAYDGTVSGDPVDPEAS